MEIKYNETGRSMVEILGVLAVIGVLSVGGIMGYRYAMDKYQANDIISSVKMRSSDIWHRYQDKELPNTTEEPKAFAEWSDTTQTGFTITIETIPEIGGFQVVARSIPNGICKQIMNMSTGVIGQDGIKFVNVDTGETLGGISLCEGEETKSIVFTSFLSETNADGKEVGECIIDSQCCSVCGESICDKENGYICSSGCGEKEVCNTETQTCEEIDVCVEGSEFRSKTGACISCVAKGGYEISSKDEPWLEVALNIQDTASGKEQCSKCGRSVEEVNGKTYCTTVCLVGKGYIPMTGVKNTGEITQYAENDYINGCVSCDNPNDYPIVSSAQEVIKNCQACGHSTYRNPLYPQTDMCGPMTCASGEFKYFYGSDGSGRMAAQCISCADSAPRYIGNISKFKTMCEAADCGRKVVGKYCVPICGKDKFLSAYIGNGENVGNLASCYSCTSKEMPYIGSYTENPDGIYTENETLKYYADLCRSCKDENNNSIREVQRFGTKAYCVPLSKPNCALENKFLGKDNQCHPCGTTAEVISDEHSGCSSICTGNNGTVKSWVISSNQHGIQKCVKKCNEGQFQRWNPATCYDCSTPNTIWIEQSPELNELCTACKSPNLRGVYNLGVLCQKERTCTSGTSYKSRAGSCINCAGTENASTLTYDQAGCEACASDEGVHLGRAYIVNPYNVPDDKVCVPIIPGTTISCNSLGDLNGQNKYSAGDGVLFRGGNGYCVSCNTPKDIYIGSFAEQCKSCGEQRQLNGVYCQINNGCNGGSTFWSVPAHTCVACTTSGAKIETSYDERNLCDSCAQKRSMTLKINAEQNGETTVEIKAYCVQKCGANKWQDSDGNCYTCDKGNGKGNIIGMDSTSKKLCMDCNRTVVTDDEGNTICQ